MLKLPHYTPFSGTARLWFNRWDFIVLSLVGGLVALLVWGAKQMAAPYELGAPLYISLKPTMLFSYAISTVIRMSIALFFSLLFTFTVATLAAKSQRAEKIILPFIDIMQSVPVLGFLSITVLAFIYLFPGSRLGPECAAIFAIFTSQVWNMALCFYQSLRTVPKELQEATVMFKLTAWQRFWRLEVPYAIPSLIWNTMMSLSAGWFFVVASEAISVNNQQITLPGIGSYIAKATEQADYRAICYAMLTMLLIILIYDQLLFRPLIAWSEKFKLDPSYDENPQSWFLTLLQRSRLTTLGIKSLRRIRDFITSPHPSVFPRKIPHAFTLTLPAILSKLWLKGSRFIYPLLLAVILLCSLKMLGNFIYKSVSLVEIVHVFYLGLITTIKVAVLIALSSIIWVPIGVYIGLRPRLAAIAQPITQFLAAFPANLLYPVLYMLIIRYHLNINIWSAPLMILGTQWYILFNVIAGVSSIPQDLHLATQNYGVKGWLWWRKLILPGIFPYYVTGAMTAAGGSWNASIVADVVVWGNETLRATGLGGYIAQYTTVGDFPRIGLGIVVMSLYVILINRLVWHRLYAMAENKYQIG